MNVVRTAIIRASDQATELKAALRGLQPHYKVRERPNTTPMRFGWTDLDVAGMQALNRARRLHEEFKQFLSYLIERSHPVEGNITGAAAYVDSLLNRNVRPRSTESSRYFDAAYTSIDGMLRLLEAIEDSGLRSIIVPDTNVLLDYPHIPAWQFPGLEPISVVLVPTVIREIDRLSKESRPSIRSAAKAVRNQIKDFRNRGSLAEGVPVVKGRMALLVVTSEPAESEQWPGLDMTVPDDRILASAVALMRLHPRAQVAIATRDLMMLAKADSHRLLSVEPNWPKVMVPIAPAPAALAAFVDGSARSAFEARVEQELQRAYALHGREPWNRHEFYAVLKEEVDELWDAIKADAPAQDVLIEIDQIACVCRRYVETGDRDHDAEAPTTPEPTQPRSGGGPS